MLENIAWALPRGVVVAPWQPRRKYCLPHSQGGRSRIFLCDMVRGKVWFVVLTQCQSAGLSRMVLTLWFEPLWILIHFPVSLPPTSSVLVSSTASFPHCSQFCYIHPKFVSFGTITWVFCGLGNAVTLVPCKMLSLQRSTKHLLDYLWSWAFCSISHKTPPSPPVKPSPPAWCYL